MLHGPVLAVLLLCAALFPGCSGAYRDGSISIRLEYPPSGDNSAPSSADAARLHAQEAAARKSGHGNA